jgi:N-acetylglucosaminyldiphosphoundecaprenol N-acetyl-beta-D-mannosaminyltransferase
MKVAGRDRQTRRWDPFGVHVEPLSLAQTVARCKALVEKGVAAHHVALNAGKVVLMADQPRLLEAVRRCDLVSADGQSIVWVSRLLGRRLPERVAGIDLMESLLKECESNAWPVYFLGATAEVLQTFCDVVKIRYPSLPIAGRHHGFFTDDARVADGIARSGARLLFIAMPSPRKELFVSEQSERLGALFTMGVGGSFDVWAGLTRRAPLWMQHCGLEWFYRFLQEPSRMWRRYLIGNCRFAILAIREMVSGRSA